MKAFRYHQPGNVEGAAGTAAKKGALLKAGGIDVMDRLKERVDEPDVVVGLLGLQDTGLAGT